jgi:hypothetical protein
MLVSHQLSSNLSPAVSSVAGGGASVSLTRTQDVHTIPNLAFDMEFLQPSAMNIDSMYGALEELSADAQIPPWAYDSSTSSNFGNFTYLTPSSSTSDPANPASVPISVEDAGPSQNDSGVTDSTTSPPLAALLQNIWSDL